MIISYLRKLENKTSLIEFHIENEVNAMKNNKKKETATLEQKTK